MCLYTYPYFNSSLPRIDRTVFNTFPFVFTFKVRASNLQDLVYKNGQAGITKATVSITFDNSNKSQSPLGFETHDEITVTRQVDNLIFIFIFILVLCNCVNQTSPCSIHSLNLMYA